MSRMLRSFRDEFELYVGSVFLVITSAIVIMNVFTRYFLNFTYFWAEEVAVACFVWTIFLGLANAYRTNHLIGVEALVQLLPDGARKVVDFITSIILAFLSGVMFFFSFKYVAGSTKITAALEISYIWINSVIVISFGLMTIYSIYSIYNVSKSFIKENSNKNNES